MNLTILKNLGLNDKEIMIYTTLIKSGASSVRSIAEISEINRGTVYDILKKLQETGLVSYYHEKTKQKFVAESPDKLMKLVEDEESKIRNVKDDLCSLIPELKSLQGRDDEAPVTKFYEGRGGIKTILLDVLSTMSKTSEKTYYAYSAKDASNDINSAYLGYTKKRVNEKIRVKVISLAQGGNLNGLDERRWLGTENNSATFIIIYQNKCAFISRGSTGKPVGVIIENKMIYETQKGIFLQLWGFLK